MIIFGNADSDDIRVGAEFAWRGRGLRTAGDEFFDRLGSDVVHGRFEARGREMGCIQPGDIVIITAGVDRKTGSTDTIWVSTVDSEEP